MATRTHVTMLDMEKSFPIEGLFFSTTNQQGVILHGNRLFSEVSEYDEAELLGAAHSVVRHPDMPRAVFQLLWDTIQSGKTIAAYVKNATKQGKYYWVLAVVMPCELGYLSIRLRPSSTLFPEIRRVYGKMLQVERMIEVEAKHRREAIQASTVELEKQLRALGFQGYDDFMLQALSTEMASRIRQLPSDYLRRFRPVPSTCRVSEVYNQTLSLDQKLQGAYERIEEFKLTNVALMEKSESILSMAESIRILSMNATIAASKLGPRGATLQVVSESLGTISDDSQQATRQLAERMGSVVRVLDRLIFDLASTKLQSEIALQFVEEVLHHEDASNDPRLHQSLKVLFDEMASRIHAVFQHLQEAEEGMVELQSRVHRLARNNRTLRFVQFAGEKESTGSRDMEAFAEVFKQVRSQIDRTKGECDSLALSISNSCKEAKQLGRGRQAILPHLDIIQQYDPVSL